MSETSGNGAVATDSDGQGQDRSALTAAIPVRRSVKREASGKVETMNGPLYKQSANKVVLVRRLKRKGGGVEKQLSRWFVENQIGM